MKRKYLIGICFLIVQPACTSSPLTEVEVVEQLADSITIITPVEKTSIVVLGNVQDAGSPQIACKKDCCKDLFDSEHPKRRVVSLGVVDPIHQKKYLFEATPDITQQLKFLKQHSGEASKETVEGVFLTHAHIGHYTGLLYFGKEAMNADSVSVYAMPKMSRFLTENGPWSQLVTNGNIALIGLENEREVRLTNEITVVPLTVPHRDEFSETVGYKIIGKKKSALFIPDIDKWEKWEKGIEGEIAKVDYAFLDATFFDGEEINNRDISQIPHPFVIESMERFENLLLKEKNKIYFIHFNHSNPLLKEESKQTKQVLKNGYNIARVGDVFEL